MAARDEPFPDAARPSDVRPQARLMRQNLRVPATDLRFDAPAVGAYHRIKISRGAARPGWSGHGVTLERSGRADP